MKTKLYTTGLKTVQNQATNKTRYYMFILEQWTRVSKEAYEAREIESHHSDCFLTVIKNGLIHNSKQVYLYID